MTARRPTFAFLTVGSGTFPGSMARDLAIANVLHRRGYKVAIYWMLAWSRELAEPGIVQRLLCHGSRYRFRRPSEWLDRVVGGTAFRTPTALRRRLGRYLGADPERVQENLVRVLYDGPDADRALVQRLRRYLARDGVSHLVVSFASLGPLALAARRAQEQGFEYLLTFQGDEGFADYARRAGRFEDFMVHMNDAVRGSPWPAVVVSQDYRERLSDELGVPSSRMQVLFNGGDLPRSGGKPLFSVLKKVFPNLIEGIPVVSYIGRQDVEKGIDLLLYAVRLLETRGVPLQLVVCGVCPRGSGYPAMIAGLADQLGVLIHHYGAIPPDLRDALYAHSRCVVCPSVNREPFSLVAAEAMAAGTPVLVPDCGGVAEMVRDGDVPAGLTFRSWDSGDLACQLRRLLVDEALHRELAANAPGVAARFSAESMADRLLAHLGIVSGSTIPVVDELSSALDL